MKPLISNYNLKDTSPSNIQTLSSQIVHLSFTIAKLQYTDDIFLTHQFSPFTIILLRWSKCALSLIPRLSVLPTTKDSIHRCLCFIELFCHMKEVILIECCHHFYAVIIQQNACPFVYISLL